MTKITNQEETQVKTKTLSNETAEIELAIQNRDYDAWIDIVRTMPQGDKIVNIISEEEFELLIELQHSKEIYWKNQIDAMPEISATSIRENYKDYGGEETYRIYEGGGYNKINI